VNDEEMMGTENETGWKIGIWSESEKD